LPPVPGGPVRAVPLGTVAGARSGDKGGNANVGLWVDSPEAYAWLASSLTVDRIKELLPETAPLRVHRHELPNLLAINVVVVGLLGEGVAASTRPDPQAKSLGEALRACVVDVPESLL
ncbi:MAG TPA: exopolyphosphatase, partial [Acidimicrobiales bacterium]|nr:exopolyphosphatase [Acidimicrobiales bacterium]